jgi:phosphatidylglycerophosphate synthase
VIARAPAAAAAGAKPLDAWWTVLVVDPLALRVLPFLNGLGFVTPLRLTLAGAALSAASIPLFATEHFVVGALLFQAGFFFDCLDGKLARMRGETSAIGAFLDQALDVLVRTGAFVALAWHAFPDSRIAPVLVAAVVLFESWLRIYPAERPGGAAGTPLRGVLGRARAALARRRLVLLPSTVDFETLSLFLAPLTGSVDVIRVALLVALAGYAFYCLLHVRRLVRA